MSAPLFIEQKQFAGLSAVRRHVGFAGFGDWADDAAFTATGGAAADAAAAAPPRKEISAAQWASQVNTQWAAANPAAALELKARTKGAKMLGGGLVLVGLVAGFTGNKTLGLTLGGIGAASLAYGFVTAAKEL